MAGSDAVERSAASRSEVLVVSDTVRVPLSEVEMRPIRAQGPGGQNVNKVAAAIHLRFDLRASSLPAEIVERLLELNDRRISKEGVVVIKAQRFRSLEKNRDDGLARLRSLLERGTRAPPARKRTRPPARAHRRRLEEKSRRALVKSGRAKVEPTC